MTFAKLAYARQVLRAMAGEKTAMQHTVCIPMPDGNIVVRKPHGFDELSPEQKRQWMHGMRQYVQEQTKTAMAGALGSFGRAAGGVGRLLGGTAKAVGKPLNWAWQKSMQQNGKVLGTVGLGAGILGTGALAKKAIGQTHAAYHGFQPEVQAYTRQSPYGQ